MKKLIRGILDFRKNIRPGYKETFAQLALGQHPDTLFVACSDSRVVPNLFASSDPGDLFVVRNVGNLIPPCNEHGHSAGDQSPAAALEFALWNLPVTEVIVCGHSQCGAMMALLRGRTQDEAPNLKSWLSLADQSLRRLQANEHLDNGWEPHNQLSQLNVLQQLEHLKTYPVVGERLAQGTLRLHGWWFDIKQAEVYSYEPDQKSFQLIDETYAPILLNRLEKA